MKTTTLRSLLANQLGAPDPIPKPRVIGLTLSDPATTSCASRALELLMISAGCVVFAPLFCAIPLLIHFDDRGPIFFRQTRCGYRRRPFPILKFRTMDAGAVTRVGRWLRKTGLDEIAQFFNVLSGHMSIVGPRPLTHQDIARLGWEGDSFNDRWEVKPGITGLAQVFGGRSARHSLRLDRIYLRRKSVALDLWLIAISFAMNGLGKQRTRSILRSIRRWGK